MNKTKVEIKVKKHPRLYSHGTGQPWYSWQVLVDGEVYADGEESTRTEAQRKAKLCEDEYKNNHE